MNNSNNQPDVSHSVPRETILPDVSRETISELIQQGNQLLDQVANLLIPLREISEPRSDDWWNYQQAIDDNMLIIRYLQMQIKQRVKHNVSRETIAEK